MTKCGQGEIDELKKSKLSSYATQKTKHSLNRFLQVMRDARHYGPARVDDSLLRGPPKLSSHLVDSYDDRSATNIEEDDTSIIMFDEIIHGVKGLLLARRRKKALLVYRLCMCGVCVTDDDLKYHYSLLVFAAQMTSSERMPRDFLEYVIHVRQRPW